MRMLIIAIIAIIVVGGGGAGAYFYLMPSEEGEGELAAAEEKADPNAKTAYVEMDPFVLSVLGKEKAHETVSIAVVIEVKAEEYVADVEAKKPRLNHYFLEELYDSLGKKVDQEGKKNFSISDIQSKLKKISKNTVGDDKVKDVLIQLISRHPV